MAAAARDYLAVPASEVAVEGVYSTVRHVLGFRRYSLNWDTKKCCYWFAMVIKGSLAVKGLC